MDKNVKNSRIAFGVYFYIAMCFVLIRMLSAFGLLSFLKGTAGYVFTLVVQVVLLFGGSVLAYSFISKQKVKHVLKDYGYRKTSSKVVIISILVGVVVFVINIFVSNFFNSIIRALGYSSSRASVAGSGYYPVWLLFVNLIFTAVLPAICEETAHRGMLLNACKGFSRGRAIFITAIMFGLLHLNIEQFFYATIIGLYLGYVVEYTQSIVPAMIIHFMNNALSVLLTFSGVHGLSLARIYAKVMGIISSNIAVGIIFVASLLVILLYLLFQLTIFLISTLLKERMDEEKKNIINFFKRQDYLIDVEKITNKIPENKFDVVEIDLNKFFATRKKSKIDKVSLTFIILSISMMAVLTIFTFVWGVI